MTDSNENQNSVEADPVIIDAQFDGESNPTYTTVSGMEPSEERTLAMFSHLAILLNLITGFLGLQPPIVIYFAYKDRSKYVAYQALQALIFQGVFFFGAAILAAIAWVITFVLSFVIVGVCLFPFALILTLVPFGALVYGIVAAVDTHNHRDFKYWLIGDWVRDTYEG